MESITKNTESEFTIRLYWRYWYFRIKLKSFFKNIFKNKKS